MMLSWKKVRASFNIKIPFKKYFENIGMPFDSILKKLEIKNNKNLIFNEYRKESIKNFKKIKLYPDVKKTLNILKKHYKLAIVTSKDKDRTSMILNKFNISFIFTFLIKFLLISAFVKLLFVFNFLSYKIFINFYKVYLLKFNIKNINS